MMDDRNHDTTPTDPTTTDTDPETTVCLPKHLTERIDPRLSETNFDSIDEYVTFALEALLRELSERDDDEIVPDPHERSKKAPEESEAMQERLESLGYL